MSKIQGIFGSRDNTPFVRNWLFNHGGRPSEVNGLHLVCPDNIYIVNPINSSIDIINKNLSYLVDCVTAPKPETFVDLGLPSGTLWSERNLLADDIANHGGFFPFDQTLPYLPKKWQYEELIEECEWEWVETKNFTGYKVIGKNGNYILLPAAGYISEGSCHANQKDGIYWSNTKSSVKFSWALHFSKGYIKMTEMLNTAERTLRTIKV